MDALRLETCSHERLLELDQTQGYTAVANNVMLHVISNPIIASASRLWILIRFQQSGFYDREYIDRTIGWFAKQLNVSSSTIQKWQRLLEREGYLEIIEQKYKSKNNRPNRYRACLPKAVAKQLKAEGKVYTKYTSKSEGDSLNKEEGRAKATPIKSLKESDNAQAIIPIPKEKIYNIFTKAPDWLQQLLPGLTFEIEGDCLWITGVHTLARNLFLNEQSRLLKLLNELGFSIQSLAFNRDQKISNVEPPAKAKTVVRDQAEPIYGHTRHRIYKRLLNTSINGHTLQPNEAKRLSAEVIYAVEQGSFCKHPTALAINIVLKLIRENRWRTPAGYPQMGSQIQ